MRENADHKIPNTNTFYAVILTKENPFFLSVSCYYHNECSLTMRTYPSMTEYELAVKFATPENLVAYFGSILAHTSLLPVISFACNTTERPRDEYGPNIGKFMSVAVKLYAFLSFRYPYFPLKSPISNKSSVPKLNRNKTVFQVNFQVKAD